MTSNLLLAALPWSSRSLAEQMTLVMHISAGSIAIISGFVALFVAKGAPRHRQAGIFFVYSMLVMSLLGALTATVWNRALFINLPAGLMTAYLVATSMTTVRPDWGFTTRSAAVGLMLVALVVGSYNAFFAVRALTSETGRVFGFPAFPFILFGALGLLAALGDARVLRAGMPTGARRLTRHLWRMTFAMFIATASFFFGQAKVIPEPIRILPLLAIPPLTVVAALLYWLWRVRFRQSLRGLMISNLGPIEAKV